MWFKTTVICLPQVAYNAGDEIATSAFPVT